MIQTILAIAIIVFVAGVCINHAAMRRKRLEGTELDAEFVRRAAQLSVEASQTSNGLLALSYVTRAIQILELMHEKYGVDSLSARTNVNTADLLGVICNQRNRIHQDVVRTYPEHAVKHTLANTAGMEPEYSSEGE